MCGMILAVPCEQHFLHGGGDRFFSAVPHGHLLGDLAAVQTLCRRVIIIEPKSR